MTGTTLDHPVKPGNLILFYNTAQRHMLLVMSVPEDEETYPTTASVIVQKVSWHVPALKGHWVFDGPVVYYSNDGSEEDDRNRLCDEHFDDHPESSLDDFLRSMESSDPTQNTETDESCTLIINPHGRDVLQHYFQGWCPNCGDKGWFCPRSASDDGPFPDIGSGSADQACPMCMGFEFARNDRAWISEPESIEDGCRGTTDDGYLEELRNAGIASTRARYEAISERRREMGMPLEDFDDAIKHYEDTFNESKPKDSK